MFIGDSFNDALAAKAAGLLCLMVPYGYNEGQALEKPENGDLVDNLMNVATWIAAKNA